jgi:hypothetical protein
LEKTVSTTANNPSILATHMPRQNWLKIQSSESSVVAFPTIIPLESGSDRVQFACLVHGRQQPIGLGSILGFEAGEVPGGVVKVVENVFATKE